MTALRVAHKALIRPFKSGPLVEGVWVKCQPGAISIPHRIRFDSANYSRNRPEVVPDGIGELARNFAAPYYNGKRLGRRFGRRWCGEPNDYIGEPETFGGLPIAEDGTPLCCLLPLATRRGGLIIDGVGSVNRFGAVAVGLLQAVLTWDATVEADSSILDDWATAVSWQADVQAGQHDADDWVTAVSWTASVEANSAYLDSLAPVVEWTAETEANSAYRDTLGLATSWLADVETSSDGPAVPCPYCDDVPASWTITVSGIGAGEYDETECGRLNGTFELADFYGPGESGTTCTWYSSPIASDIPDSAWYWAFSLVSDGFGETPPVYWHLSVQRWSVSGGVLLEIPAVWWNNEAIEPCDVTQVVSLMDTFGQCDNFPATVDVDPVTG